MYTRVNTCKITTVYKKGIKGKMTNNTQKLVSVRLPIEDYESLCKIAEDFNVSLSRVISTAIRSGLILINGEIENAMKEAIRNAELKKETKKHDVELKKERRKHD